MAFVLPTLSFLPGVIHCLHIPHKGHEDAAGFETAIQELAAHEGKIVQICRPATRRRGFREFFWRQRSAEWLAHAAQISRREAERTIVSFGVPVCEILSLNAGTPRCLLGVAAVLHQRPEVLIYSTAGIDPLGIMAAHRLVSEKAVGTCAVHLSYPTIFGDGSPAPRHCPEKGLCTDLFRTSEVMDNGVRAEQKVAPDCGGIK